MDDYRRKMAERYKQTPEAEKPHVKTCDVCKRYEHEFDVCPVSGLYHHKPGRIVCGQRLDDDDRIITGSRFTAMLSTLRIAWQKPRTEELKIDEDSISIFQSFAMSRNWQLQRMGIMYGIIRDTSVEVHTIYEPEQECSADDATLTHDPRLEKVDRLASMLGLSRVGVIMSHNARNKDEIVLTGKDLLLCAKEQSRFGDKCVLVTVSPNAETRQTEVEVWQTSEQCVQLYRAGYLEPCTKRPGFVTSKVSLEVAEVKKDSKGAPQMVCKEPSRDVDARWMTAPVAVQAFNSTVITSRFIRISRPGEAPPTLQNLKNYMMDPKRAGQRFVEKVADFHVLVFLMETILDIRTDLPMLVQSILIGDDEGCQGHKFLIEQYLDA
eukprot:PhM_4_TR13612/c0_g1_i1/m.9460/K14015/NPLOC4, NPL4; nuclear protein localization protein 4 homolog